MKLINRNNYFRVVCISFTLIVTGKLILEKIIGHTDRYYSDNILICLGFCIVIPAILSLHYYLQRFPLIPVLIGQYIAALFATAALVYILDKISRTDTNAMWQMILSMTIPYIIGSVYYYISFFRQVKKANNILSELKTE